MLANVKRHVDLGVFTNLRALHIYSLQYRSATLHLLSHLSSPHIREIKLDASFEYIRQIKAKDFMDHDTILAKPHFSNLTEVRVRYSGPLTPKRVERKIVSVFPKTSAKGTLRVVKVRAGNWVGGFSIYNTLMIHVELSSYYNLAGYLRRNVLGSH